MEGALRGGVDCISLDRTALTGIVNANNYYLIIIILDNVIANINQYYNIVIVKNKNKLTYESLF